jgi:hypothetical protein
MVGPALAAGPSRDARDNRDGLPTSGSPTIVHRKSAPPEQNLQKLESHS